MNTTLGDDTPDGWGITDDISLQMLIHVQEIAEVAEHNALVFFAHRLIIDDMEDERALLDDDMELLDAFMDQAVAVDKIVKRYMGDNYISDYIESLEEDDEQH